MSSNGLDNIKEIITNDQHPELGMVKMEEITITFDAPNNSEIEEWLDKNPGAMEELFLKKAEPSTVSKWLVKNGYCALSDLPNSKLSSFSEDNCSPTSPSDQKGDVFFTKLSRNNSKKYLRHDFAKSKYRNMFRTYQPTVTDKNADDRRNSLKEMRMFRSLPPNSINMLSLLIQSKIRLPRYPSKDIDKKREERHHNEMSFFMDIVKDISNDLDLRSLSEKIVANVSVLTDADHASVFVVEGKNNNKPSLVSKLFDVHSGAQIMPTKTANNCIRVPWGKGIIGCVAECGETVNLLQANKVNYMTVFSSFGKCHFYFAAENLLHADLRVLAMHVLCASPVLKDKSVMDMFVATGSLSCFIPKT